MRVKWLFLTLNTIRAKFLFESLSYNINNIITHLFMHFILFFLPIYMKDPFIISTLFNYSILCVLLKCVWECNYCLL